ncbi:MAG: hypothetical protein NTW05_08605, partial [Pseudonocardiales bacterium]|nr:hypothetical protein [Pseudonocardiales bacterium]
MESMRSSVRRRRGVLATVLAFPLVAGAATWGIADGWLGLDPAVVQSSEEDGGARGPVPALPGLVSGTPRDPGPAGAVTLPPAPPIHPAAGPAPAGAAGAGAGGAEEDGAPAAGVGVGGGDAGPGEPGGGDSDGGDSDGG